MALSVKATGGPTGWYKSPAQVSTGQFMLAEVTANRVIFRVGDDVPELTLMVDMVGAGSSSTAKADSQGSYIMNAGRLKYVNQSTGTLAPATGYPMSPQIKFVVHEPSTVGKTLYKFAYIGQTFTQYDPAVSPTGTYYSPGSSSSTAASGATTVTGGTSTGSLGGGSWAPPNWGTLLYGKPWKGPGSHKTDPFLTPTQRTLTHFDDDRSPDAIPFQVTTGAPATRTPPAWGTPQYGMTIYNPPLPYGSIGQSKPDGWLPPGWGTPHYGMTIYNSKPKPDGWLPPGWGTPDYGKAIAFEQRLGSAEVALGGGWSPTAQALALAGGGGDLPSKGYKLPSSAYAKPTTKPSSSSSSGSTAVLVGAGLLGALALYSLKGR